MSISTRIREQIISTFRTEVAEHIQTITDGLLLLEKRQQAPEEYQATLQSVFRAAHSLKGAARAVGVTAVEQLGHGLENILSDFQKGEIEPNPDLYTACYHALDAIQIVEAAYAAGETTPPLVALQSLTELEKVRGAATRSEPGPATTSPFSEESLSDGPQPVLPGEGPSQLASTTPAMLDETIRVQVDKLDAVIAQLSELLMAKIRLDQRRQQINQLKVLVAEWQKEWLFARDNYTQVKYARKDRSGRRPEFAAEKDADSLWFDMLPAQSLAKEIYNKLSDLNRDYSNDTIHLSLVINALEQEVKQIRLLPLSTITATFARMARNLANNANKEVVFEITGADVELDKRVLELVKDPLIHLLRNAIDHGIEPPAEREHQGKPIAGKVTLSAENLGKDVLLRVSDDGRGLDMAAIRRAVSRFTGLETQQMAEPDLVSWIFTVGVSTSPIVTDVSGRGIGLDVVRRNVEALQGRIDVSSIPAGGTNFLLTIPMALTSSHALLVQSASNVFAFPLGAIERIISFRPSEVLTIGGQEVLQRDEGTIPLFQLKMILGLPEQEESTKDIQQRLAVILNTTERRMAFIVDELIGEQEIVIKGLGNQLIRIGGITGATVLGSGKVVLVLNAADLIKMASRSENRGASTFHPVIPPAKKAARKRILVVDDSITTRTLERHILEAEGFIIQVATDGQEALNAIATSGLPDLVITDLSMPRVDGFELTSRLKNDPRTSSLPVILVTSLDSSEDKAHGVQVGADAYIVKSSFDQANLLETIQQLIG